MPTNTFLCDSSCIKGREFYTSTQFILVQAEEERNLQSSTNKPCTTHLSTTNFCILHLFCIEGKMKIYLYSVFNFICYFYQSASTKIKPELKRNISHFGYSINYKYEGMFAHSFHRFYIVTKFILPCIGDLDFSKLNYDNTCTYLDNKNTHSTETKKHTLDLMIFCKKIEPSVVYYKTLIKSYNNTAHSILENEINLIVP